MDKSLDKWLKVRLRVESALAGKGTKKSPREVMQIFQSHHDWAGEQRLASELHALLSQAQDPQLLPDPDVRKNPRAAIQLAEIALGKPSAVSLPGPAAQGILPFILVGAIAVVGLGALVSSIRNTADVEKAKIEAECKMMGACGREGWYLAAGLGVLFLWEMGLGDTVKKALKR